MLLKMEENESEVRKLKDKDRGGKCDRCQTKMEPRDWRKTNVNIWDWSK